MLHWYCRTVTITDLLPQRKKGDSTRCGSHFILKRIFPCHDLKHHQSKIVVLNGFQNLHKIGSFASVFSSFGHNKMVVLQRLITVRILQHISRYIGQQLGRTKKQFIQERRHIAVSARGNWGKVLFLFL